MREAMKRLSAKGLVEVRPRLGTSVQSRDRWSLLDPEVMDWCQQTEPSLKVMLQLRERREFMEPVAVVLACQRAKEDDVERIMAAYGRIEAGVSHPESYARADAEFHLEILRTACNSYLCALGGLIATDLLTSIKITNPDTERNVCSLKSHKEVASAIAQRNSKQAEKAMRVFLKDAGHRLREAYKTSH